MSVVVAGGAGFIGSHLVDRLVKEGKEVVVLDDLCTGYIANLELALATGRCTFVYCDVAGGTRMLREMIAKAAKTPVTQIYHLASPDSRKAYTTMPWDTLTVNSVGTMSLVDLAIEYRATLLFASSSEIYGDPLVHPQAESYTGNVNPVGRRACYEESKRFGEMTVSVGIERRGLDGRIVRLFDTYGPRMTIGDGRLIPSVLEAIASKSAIEIHGNGQQTRSFTYVTDIVSGLLAVMGSRSPHVQPVNLGSDNEVTVEEIARSLAHIAGVQYDFVYRPVRPEDPRRSRPDLRVARSMGWSAQMPLEEGLCTTHEWFTAVRPEFAYA